MSLETTHLISYQSEKFAQSTYFKSERGEGVISAVAKIPFIPFFLKLGPVNLCFGLSSSYLEEFALQLLGFHDESDFCVSHSDLFHGKPHIAETS